MPKYGPNSGMHLGVAIDQLLTEELDRTRQSNNILRLFYVHILETLHTSVGAEPSSLCRVSSCLDSNQISPNLTHRLHAD